MSKSRNMKTDTKTDMMYRYFINESKVKPEKIEELYKDFDPNKPKLQEEYSSINEEKRYSTGNVNLALPEDSHQIDDDDDDDGNNDDDKSSEQQSHQSHHSNHLPFVKNAKAFVETPGDRRKRQIEYYDKLMDLKRKYGIKLDRNFTLDDDPDEMQTQYELLYNRRKKEKSVKFYKQLLVGGVSWVESTNENYNPFDFSLEGWSENVNADIDDYNDIMEELYDKYKSVGSNAPPEVRLLTQLTMSAIMFNASKRIFGRDNQQLSNDDDRVKKAREAMARKHASANPNNKLASGILDEDEENNKALREANSKKEWDDKMKQLDLERTKSMNYNQMLQEQMRQLQMEKEQFSKQRNEWNQHTNQTNNTQSVTNKTPVSSVQKKVQNYNEPTKPPNKKSHPNNKTKTTQMSDDDNDINIELSDISVNKEDEILKDLGLKLSEQDLSQLDNTSDAGVSTATRNKKKKPLKL